MINRIRKYIKTHGAAGLLYAAIQRIAPPRARCFGVCEKAVAECIGLELGGPSAIFRERGLLPLYPLASRIDNCNFASATVWRDRIDAGLTFRYSERHEPGRQYIAEATQLDFISSDSYDFVLSSHTLEHVANPLAALHEWKRVLKNGGLLVMALPQRERTFDHRRPVTTLAHLIEDYEKGTAESDLTHLPEVLALHDLNRDPEAGGKEEFKARSEKNFENRCLHHHVFDPALAAALIGHVGMEVVATETARPFHIIVIARKTAAV